MNRDIVVGVAITKDDNDKLMIKLREWEDKTGKRATISTFIYQDLILPYLNGTEIRQEDPPLEQNAKPANIPSSEPPRKDPFSFDDL